MRNIDVRWVQKFNNFCKTLDQLTKFIQKQHLKELEIQGLVQSFEYNYELPWNTIKVGSNLPTLIFLLYYSFFY